MSIRLDLTEIEWPICLLEFNKALEETKAGDTLEVVVDDRDVLMSVSMIVHNSPSQIIAVSEVSGHSNIRICKCEESLGSAGAIKKDPGG